MLALAHRGRARHHRHPLVHVGVLRLRALGIRFTVQPLADRAEVVEEHRGQRIGRTMESRTISVLGLRTRVLEANPGAGGQRPPTRDAIVLVHGVGGWAENWRAVMPPLAATGRRVIAVDLPGFGESQRPGRVSYFGPDGAFYTRFVLAAMDALGIEHAHLVGNSLGGSIVGTVAFTSPERVRSVTLAAGGGLGLDVARSLRLCCLPGMELVARLPFSASSAHASVRTLFYDPARIPPEMYDEAVAYGLPPFPDFRRGRDRPAGGDLAPDRPLRGARGTAYPAPAVRPLGRVGRVQRGRGRSRDRLRKADAARGVLRLLTRLPAGASRGRRDRGADARCGDGRAHRHPDGRRRAGRRALRPGAHALIRDLRPPGPPRRAAGARRRGDGGPPASPRRDAVSSSGGWEPPNGRLLPWTAHEDGSPSRHLRLYPLREAPPERRRRHRRLPPRRSQPCGERALPPGGPRRQRPVRHLRRGQGDRAARDGALVPAGRLAVGPLSGPDLHVRRRARRPRGAVRAALCGFRRDARPELGGTPDAEPLRDADPRRARPLARSARARAVRVGSLPGRGADAALARPRVGVEALPRVAGPPSGGQRLLAERRGDLLRDDRQRGHERGSLLGDAERGRRAPRPAPHIHLGRRLRDLGAERAADYEV